MATPGWIPVALSALGTSIALSAFAYQVHRARFNQSVDLLFRLENDFFGPAKRIQRAKACRDLQNGQVAEAEPILDFFETMALLPRRKALDPEMVWHTFSYWIDRYYTATEDYIQERQKVEPLVWKDLVPFVQQMRSYKAAELRERSWAPLTDAQVSAFLVEEQQETTL